MTESQHETLLARITKNPLMPSLPGVALQVLDKASRPDCTLQEIGQIICLDTGLTGKLLRVVNSALFGLARPVASIQRGMAVIGLKSTRSLVLSLSLPDLQKKQSAVDPWMRDYWRASVTGAIICRELSKRQRRPDPEDDMAAGLLRDLGMLVLYHVMPAEYAKVSEELKTQPAQQLLEIEEKHCQVHHAAISAHLLNQWRFPREISEAIRWHHEPTKLSGASKVSSDLAYLLDFATRVNDLFTRPEQPELYRMILETARDRFQMSEDQLREFLQSVPKRVQELASIMKVDIGELTDVDAVIARAAEALVDLTLSANLDSQRVDEQRRRAESEARRWRLEAVFDPLTKVFNRRHLQEQLQEFFERKVADGSGLGLLFIDLDGFKPLNDRYGHAFGDLALQQVADALRKQVRQMDVVARYGGDEFCIVTECTDQRGLTGLAERTWRAINNLVIRQGENEGKVGASIGAVINFPKSTPCTVEELLAAADGAMYEAKAKGKNRICFFSLKKGSNYTREAVPVVAK